MSLGGTGQRHGKKSSVTSLLGSVRETNIIPMLVQSTANVSEAKRRRNKELMVLLDEQKRGTRKKKPESKPLNSTQSVPEETKEDEVPTQTLCPSSPLPPPKTDTVEDTVNISQPPEVINTGIILKRLEFLESELRRTQNMSKELHQRLLDKQSMSFFVSATAASDVVDEEGNVVAETGCMLKLVYPMKKNKSKTLMQLLKVDSVTAQITSVWVVVFDMIDGKPYRPVSNFTF